MLAPRPWVRQTALAAAGGPTPAPTPAERQRIEQLLALQRQIRQAGVCLNQIARWLHAGAPVAGVDLRAALADTRAALDAVLREQSGMILESISEGRGVASLVAYLTHDQVSAADPRPTTRLSVRYVRRKNSTGSRYSSVPSPRCACQRSAANSACW